MMFDKEGLIKGSKGENKVSQWLMANGYTVHDVRDVYEYRNMDVDFVAEKDGQEIKIEVKSQGSVAYTLCTWVEDILNIFNDKKGWIHYCQADFIIVYSHDRLYMYKPCEMRHYIQENELEEDYVVDPAIIDSTAIIKKVNLPKYGKAGNYFRCVEIA